MRGGERQKRGPSRRERLVPAGLVLFCGLAGTGALAADLDRHAAQPVVAGPCRLVAQPEANLAGEVVRFRRSWVCVSRGLYADTLPPPPPLQRPWWWW